MPNSLLQNSNIVLEMEIHDVWPTVNESEVSQNRKKEIYVYRHKLFTSNNRIEFMFFWRIS